MKIPKRFKLCGHTMEVVYDNLILHRNDNRGEACYRDHTIKLMPSTVSSPLPQTSVEEAFCHEMTHFILYLAGYIHEANDEGMVTRIGLLLHQALSTMEYNEEKE